jgi:hypothetical protein
MAEGEIFVLVLVLVVVLERSFANAQLVERSDAWRGAASYMAALSVSSRRLPGTCRRVAVLWAVLSPQQNRGDGQNLALGHSREPPASNR